ncbi:MAG: ABC transporter ATP-binding protein [Flavobacteriales bacterium]|jgi:ATP-binding cassette, subfamily B, multidrug efflux pump|nr:ABC transporter ATP-binding protein [Flavobacteriales bacterium]MBT4881754.1 ABC transporter ATP-binding protein [Flavobacteriales bacterium]
MSAAKTKSQKTKSGNVIDFVLLKRVIAFAKPYRLQFTIAAIAAILLSFLGPLRPLLINYAIDNYIIIPNKEKLLDITTLLLGLLFLEGFIQFFYIYLSTWIGQHVIQDLRAKIFKHILSLKMKYFDNTPIGTLVTRSVSDIETIADIFSQGLLVIIAELLKLVVVITMMFYTDWRLAIIAMLTIPILLVATAWFKRNIKASFQDVREQVSQLNTFVQEHIVGMNIVQIFNREQAEYKKFKTINQSHRDAHLRSIFYYAVFFPIVEVLSAMSIGLIVWYGGQGILEGKDITIGELIAFILFVHMMFRPIRQLADRFNILQMGIVGSERVFKVLDTDEKIADEGTETLENRKGSIAFNAVDFCYKQDEWVLKGLSFEIQAGKLLALVGRTGAGKTSIISVLNRFYEIQKGAITIDGINIDSIQLESLRKNIALVQQEVFLFSDSILNNITLFDESITRGQVIAAAKEIGVHDFISSLPKSYDYVVGERGVTLSAGQRQLIAFLRVYVRNPKILILDEATSSIDTATEELLQNALEKLSKNRTTIVIAHRLSTIVNADKILHLKDGAVLEEGTHQQLLESGGAYSDMYHLQSDANLDA